MASLDERILNKLDEHSKDIGNINVLLERNTLILEEHMKRTQLAEENIEMLRQEIRPVKDHVKFINNISKFITAVGGGLYFLDKMGWLSKIIQFLF